MEKKKEKKRGTLVGRERRDEVRRGAADPFVPRLPSQRARLSQRRARRGCSRSQRTKRSAPLRSTLLTGPIYWLRARARVRMCVCRSYPWFMFSCISCVRGSLVLSHLHRRPNSWLQNRLHLTSLRARLPVMALFIYLLFFSVTDTFLTCMRLFFCVCTVRIVAQTCVESLPD